MSPPKKKLGREKTQKSMTKTVGRGAIRSYDDDEEKKSVCDRPICIYVIRTCDTYMCNTYVIYNPKFHINYISIGGSPDGRSRERRECMHVSHIHIYIHVRTYM